MVTLYFLLDLFQHIFSPTGKGGIYFPSNFYCRVRDEDHSVRVVATPDRVPPECLEPVRFYNCHDRVSSDLERAGLEAMLYRLRCQQCRMGKFLATITNVSRLYYEQTWEL